jgi:hypothetical protein
MWIIAHRRFLFINAVTQEQHAVAATGQQEEAPDWIKDDGLFDLARKEKSIVVTEAPPAEDEDEKPVDPRVRHVKSGTGLPAAAPPTAAWKK